MGSRATRAAKGIQEIFTIREALKGYVWRAQGAQHPLGTTQLSQLGAGDATGPTSVLGERVTSGEDLGQGHCGSWACGVRPKGVHRNKNDLPGPPPPLRGGLGETGWTGKGQGPGPEEGTGPALGQGGGPVNHASQATRGLTNSAGLDFRRGQTGRADRGAWSGRRAPGRKRAAAVLACASARAHLRASRWWCGLPLSSLQMGSLA